MFHYFVSLCRIISMYLCMIQVSFYDIFFVDLLLMLFKFEHINFYMGNIILSYVYVTQVCINVFIYERVQSSRHE